MDPRLWGHACAVGAVAFVGALFVTGGGGGAPPELLRAMSGRLASLARRAPLLEARRSRVEGDVARSRALRQLPTMLDVVTLGLSAGLSFDSSLELYCSRYHDELAQAFSEAMLAWRIGVQGRGEALEGVAERLRLAALTRFADAVGQALAFGAPLATVLEHQAQAIRSEQRSQLEEEIERVPVKMLVPLGTLIVPAMLLAILGPIVGSSVGVG